MPSVEGGKNCLLDMLRGDVGPMEEAGGTASSTWDQIKALSTKNEETVQSRQDESRLDSFVSVVKDGKASRRKQAGTALPAKSS